MLARDLGYPHSDHLLKQLTPEQADDWLALYLKRPFGEFADDIRAAKISQWAANLDKKTAQKLTFSDFMPFGENQKRPTPMSLDQKTRTVLGF